jgi:hypothetical protein
MWHLVSDHTVTNRDVMNTLIKPQQAMYLPNYVKRVEAENT